MKRLFGAIVVASVVVGAVAVVRRLAHKPCSHCGEASEHAYFVPGYGIVALCSTCDGLDGPHGIATMPGEFAARYIRIH